MSNLQCALRSFLRFGKQRVSAPIRTPCHPPSRAKNPIKVDGIEGAGSPRIERGWQISDGALKRRAAPHRKAGVAPYARHRPSSTCRPYVYHR